MSISESERRDIYVNLESAIGNTAANNLMKLLPYQPADQLVTRTDMHAQTAMLVGEMAELRGELRGEMTELRSEVKVDVASLRVEIKQDIANLKVTTQRWMTGVAAANTIALVTALLT